MTDFAKRPHPTCNDICLKQFLENSLSSYFNNQSTITHLKRSASEFSTSFAIEELDITLGNNDSLKLIFKDLSKHALLPEARVVKPDFLFNPRREIEVYRSILPHCSLETADCIGSVVDETTQQYWLFLEKVPGIELYQVGDFQIWLEVARCLAGLHGSFTNQIRHLAAKAPLLHYDRDFYQRWPLRAKSFLQAQSGSTNRDMERIHKSYPKVIDRLLALPLTLLHGDFNASNVIVRQTAKNVRICPVDWEMSALGPGFIDLAALISGDWDDKQKIALIDAYLGANREEQLSTKNRETMLENVKYCQLHLAIQWMGWSPHWSPPLEHKQDWFSQAMALADELGL